MISQRARPKTIITNPTVISPRSGWRTCTPQGRKYLIRAWALHEDERQNLTRPQFARYYLMRLGIGNELKRVALNPENPYKLASKEEVLAIRPELRPPD